MAIGSVKAVLMKSVLTKNKRLMLLGLLLAGSPFSVSEAIRTEAETAAVLINRSTSDPSRNLREEVLNVSHLTPINLIA